MRKIVINTCFGGFGLSKAAQEYLGIAAERRWHELDRDDPRLIAVVEHLGASANGSYAALKVVEIPDEVEWEIQEYDGREWVAEKHRTWT